MQCPLRTKRSIKGSAGRRVRQRLTTCGGLSSELCSTPAKVGELTRRRFLIGDSVGAKADLEKSLDLVPSFVQSWVKIASVHMELG